jgi:hypothetical protein
MRFSRQDTEILELAQQAEQTPKQIGDLSATLAAHLRKEARKSDVEVIGLEQIDTCKLKGGVSAFP